MLLVEKGSKKGINVKLHPAEENKIFVASDDNSKDIVIVKGRVVRLDEPSQDVRQALNDAVYGPAENRHPLLVETDEDPTPVASTTNAPTVAAIPLNQAVDLHALAGQYGYKLVPNTEFTAENDAQVAGNKTNATEQDGSSGKSTDSGGSSSKK